MKEMRQVGGEHGVRDGMKGEGMAQRERRGMRERQIGGEDGVMEGVTEEWRAGE